MTKETSSMKGGLSSSQLEVIRMLVSGCTAKYTALVLKLEYATVRRWITKDPQFQAELAEQVERGRSQLSKQVGPSQDKETEKRRRGDRVAEETPGAAFK